MQDYLINVLMAAASYWMLATVLFVLGFAYRKKLGSFWSAAKAISGFLFFLGLFMGLSSSANTYKNEVDYNRVQDQRRIESYRDTDQEFEIVDRTIKPLTAAERANSELDMRDRVKDSTTE